jgi:hypothetical protein
MALKSIMGTRRWAITETGQHCGTFTTGFWLWKKRQRLSEAEQARKLAVTVRAFKLAGADFVVVYQLNSAPGDAPLANYGIRRADLSWRPSADVPRIG